MLFKKECIIFNEELEQKILVMLSDINKTETQCVNGCEVSEDDFDMTDAEMILSDYERER